MGVPTFYRWLCNRYPKVPKDAVDNYKEGTIDLSNEEEIGVELLMPNPNGEFDNLYLDMNGIIHPCCHPENMEQPESEEVMLKCILEYIDRIFYIVRPRKLLYMAIDGVAPRAKINQQRTRRFKSAALADMEDETYEKLAKEYREKNTNEEIPPRKKKWDSNVITPGTEFMYKLSRRLVEYIKERVEKYDAWKRIVVIFSDSNVPGEGEHKIMKFIRNQRHCPNYDPNTTHVLHGMDADLIMLGLATHEPNFYIIREIVTFFVNATVTNKSQLEKEIMDLESEIVVKKKEGLNKTEKYMKMMRENWKPLQFLQLPVLREYLSYQLKFIGGFDNGEYIDFERCIDDLVLMIFFCGNDFLPNLPSISITGGSIDQMILLYQKILPTLNDYLSNEGNINFEAIDKFFAYLSKIEDEIFRQIHEYKLKSQNNQKQNKSENGNGSATGKNSSGSEKVTGSDSGSSSGNYNYVGNGTVGGNNEGKNEEEKEMGKELETKKEKTFEEKYKEAINKLNVAEDVKLPVDVTLKDSNLWKRAYYREKFNLEEEQVEEYVKELSYNYIKGVCWVLQYYYQGCPSWSWYYPYHYSPFCSDLEFSALKMGGEEELEPAEEQNLGKGKKEKEYSEQEEDLMKDKSEEQVEQKEQNELEEEENKGLKRRREDLKIIKFSMDRPLTPFQQLMGVMPIRSSHCIPKDLRGLMTDPESPLKEFYPVTFREDPNGKRYKYQWVALLPFIDEQKLLEYVTPIEEKLNEEEKYRNRTSQNVIFITDKNKKHFLNSINRIIKSKKLGKLKSKKKENTSGEQGESELSEGKDEREVKEVSENKEESVQNKKQGGELEYFESECNKKHRSVLMKGVKLPPKVLTVQDVMEEQRNRGFNCEVAKRMILNMLANRENRGTYDDESSQEVLRDTARDYHQYHNQYNPNQYTPYSHSQNQYPPYDYVQSQYVQYNNSQNKYGSYNNSQYKVPNQYTQHNYNQSRPIHQSDPSQQLNQGRPSYPYQNNQYQNNQYRDNKYRANYPSQSYQSYPSHPPNQYVNQGRPNYQNQYYNREENSGQNNRQNEYFSRNQENYRERNAERSYQQNYRNYSYRSQQDQDQYQQGRGNYENENYGNSNKRQNQGNRNQYRQQLKRSSNEKYF